MTSRCWCFTLNGTHDFAKLNNIKKWSYMVAGREVSETGTKHLQGFVIYKTRTKFSTVKNQIPLGHIERMIGNSEQASEYCKKDQDFQEFGEFELINGYKNSAEGGVQSKINYEKIIQMAEDHNPKGIRKEDAGVYWRGYHTIQRIMMDNPLPVDDLDQLDNEWIWGKTGLGKSRNARLENPGCYIKSHNKWWLGYKGEHVVLIDDLSKTEGQWFGEHLKQWCDHYAFPSETKGSGRPIRPQKIIVTSNYSIEDIWGHDENLCESLLRRFKVRHIVEPFPQPPKKVAKMVPPEEKEYSEVSISTDDEEIENHDEMSEEF